MALQYSPIVLGVMLVVAVGTFAYSLWNSNSQQNYSYKTSNTYRYDCGYDTKSTNKATDESAERKRKRKNTNTDCIICLESLKENIRKLPCQHSFHKKCIENWFQNDKFKTCPICRKSSNYSL